MDEQPKRPRGRPPAPPGTALDAYLGLRMETPLKEKCKEGGDEWARNALRKAKLPKKPPPPAE